MAMEGEGLGQAQGQEFWDGVSVTYTCTIKKHLHQDVFQGYTSPSNLPQGRRRQVSIIAFQNENDCANYCKWANNASPSAFLPDMITRRGNEGFLGVGKDVGIPLVEWILCSNLQIWEYNTTDFCLRAGKDLRKVGRWLGAAVSVVHMKGAYVGNLLKSAYVNEEAKCVSFVSKNQNLSPEDGIIDDLNNLADFVELVTRKRPPTSIDFPPDVDMFFQLHQHLRNISHNLDLVKEFSYFLSHAPLYWDFQQRKSFYYTYYSLRHPYLYTFDKYLSFKYTTNINDNWRSEIQYHTPLHDVLTYEGGADYNDRFGLMTFHRACIEHNKGGKSEEDTDYKLLELFSDAVPKAYHEFVINCPFAAAQKIVFLKGGLSGLDYVALKEVVLPGGKRIL